MQAKEPRISVRVSDHLKQRLEKIVAQTGIDEAAIVRNCLEAVCAEVEQTGTLTFPLAVSSRRERAAYPPARPAAAALNEPASCDSAPARPAKRTVSSAVADAVEVLKPARPTRPGRPGSK